MTYSPSNTTFPTTLDSLVNPTDTSDTSTFDHAGLESTQNNAIEALQAKVGVNSSAVTSSLDYIVKSTSSSNPGHKHTLVNGATDVTSSAAELNVLDGIPGTLTATELGYVDGVTSAIQTQINTKAPTASPTFTGDVGIATTANIQVNAADPKRTMYVPASAMFPSTTAPCASITQVESSTNDVNIKVLDFDGAGTNKEYAEFGIQSPTYWDAGTITAQFVWYATAGSGTVNWEIQGLAFSDDDALDTAYGTLQEVTDTLLATGDVHITAETSAVTIAGTPAAGDWLQFKVARDPANDTNTSDARLMGVRIRFGIAQYNDA